MAGSGRPASEPYHPPPPDAVYPRPMEQAERRSPENKKSTGWWRASPDELKARDAWFKTPRNTTWTIDSAVNGKQKPSGYDSNSLITIIRSAQCLTAIAVLILYVFTVSAPSIWLIALAAAASIATGFWSIFALFLRHVWSAWVAIPEVLLTVAWITLFIASSTATPEDSKAEVFKVATIAMEACMVFAFPTCLLAVTPFFHKCMPWLFHVRSRDGHGERDGAIDAGIEMPPLPHNAITTPPRSRSAEYSRTSSSHRAAPRPPPPPLMIPHTSDRQAPAWSDGDRSETWHHNSTRSAGSRSIAPNATYTTSPQRYYPPLTEWSPRRPTGRRSVSSTSTVAGTAAPGGPVSPMAPGTTDPFSTGFAERPRSPPPSPYARSPREIRGEAWDR
ncbi:hypothetical protein F4779DRAFT_474460 [Xylariaceae sp. FL0662B]|nr:hypothetical protein F4779DRAFT_474460 [Xylariaceae sp. FL0662B]